MSLKMVINGLMFKVEGLKFCNVGLVLETEQIYKFKNLKP